MTWSHFNEDIFWEYCRSLADSIPEWSYEAAIYIFIIGAIIMWAFKGLPKAIAPTAKLFLFNYTGLLLSSTVFFRETKKDVLHQYRPFWSYEAISKGVDSLVPENIMNLAIFIPIGIATGLAFKSVRCWQALLTGLSISVLIEALQLTFKKGCSETDDVIHNTLGCLLGYLFYISVKSTCRVILR